MANYVLLEHYNANGGKLGISYKVFAKLAEKCIEDMKEIQDDKANIVNISIRNNTVTYRIVVSVKPGVDTEKVKNELEDKINNSLLLTCETVPFQMNIKVIEKALEA